MTMRTHATPWALQQNQINRALKRAIKADRIVALRAKQKIVDPVAFKRSIAEGVSAEGQKIRRIRIVAGGANAQNRRKPITLAGKS